MVDLKAIRVFLAVAERQSFSMAARDLGLAPASVTRIIAQLEETLGKQLLVRTTRQVGLTSEGAVVAARYRPVVDEFDTVTEDIFRDGHPDRGALRITAPVSLGVQLLPEALSGFQLAYPNIALDVQFTDTLLDVIAEDCDLAIRVSGPPKDKSTIWRKLCEIPRRAVASPSLFRKIPRPRSPDELDPSWLMSYSPDGSREAGGRVISNNGDFLYALAASGNGICVLPDFIAAEGLRTGEVVEVMPGWSLSSLWLTLFYPPYEQLPPLVGTFADYFERYIQERSDDVVPHAAPLRAQG